MPDNHFRSTFMRANHVRTVINDLQYSVYNLFTIKFERPHNIYNTMVECKEIFF